MIRLYPEQLLPHLRDGLRTVYLLTGSDPLLLQESQDAICASARQQEFDEQHHWHIDNNSDWQEIFACCSAMSLFSSRQILLLVMPENGINPGISQQLTQLTRLLHDDLLLILRMNKFSKALQNQPWFNSLSQHTALITCQTPEREQLPRWLSARARQLNLHLDDAANQLLCYCYEGNLLALAQALERLSLLWPDGKLTLPRVEQAVNDAAYFTPFHWANALLSGKSKRALHTLRQLRQQGCEPVILLRTLQRELLRLISLKHQSATLPLQTLFDQQHIWKNHRPLISGALQRLNWQQLHQALRLLSRCELTLKQDFDSSIWHELEGLSLLLTHSQLPEVLING